MIQVQDPGVTPPINNSVSAQNSSSDAPANPADKQANEKGIDELLAQLEKLNQEIENKSVAQTNSNPVSNQAPVQPEKIEAPEPTPSLPANDDISLPAPEPSEKKDDFDLDAFIKELEAKLETQKDSASPESSNQATVETSQAPAVDTDPNPTMAEADEDAFFRKLRSKADLEEETEEAVADLDIPAAAPTQLAESDESAQAETDSQSSQELDKLIADLEQSLADFEKKKKAADSMPADSTIPAAPVIEGVPANEVTAPEASQEPEAPEAPQANQESLEAQNIFTMLNLNDLDESEQEAFLNDLEKLIWDNFIATDLPLLLNNEQKARADEIMAAQAVNENQKKEQLLVFLDDIVPNLEQVMYKKAIDLKLELFEERLRKTRDQAQADNNLELIADLDQIDDLIKADRYQTAVQLLNKV